MKSSEFHEYELLDDHQVYIGLSFKRPNSSTRVTTIRYDSSTETTHTSQSIIGKILPNLWQRRLEKTSSINSYIDKCIPKVARC